MGVCWDIGASVAIDGVLGSALARARRLAASVNDRMALLASVMLAALTVALFPVTVRAGEAKVAVAANFASPAKEIATLFEKATGHTLVLSVGATGQFYAQISQGAPFDVLLAADQATPAKAVSEGFAVDGTVATYAVGTLVLYGAAQDAVHGEQTLRDARFAKLAVANPATAPYGAAAIETMMKLGVYETLRSRIVEGRDIAQTYQFVATANAEVGFVALSQVALAAGGSRWIVPETLHAPIAQDRVLLKQGADNAAAKAFLTFLAGPEARAVIEKFGYGVRL